MLKSPHLLILDEPTNHLDLASRESIERAVSEFRGTVIAVSHDRYYLNNCVTKILAFDENGLTTFGGNYDAYKKSRSLVELGIPSAEITKAQMTEKSGESYGKTHQDSAST
ncbi:hypothetical protein ADUPG1_003813, partial [Aduncisulcus paluster]